ncbi:MAG: DUF1643 domain-containing protein [Phycisphaerales bacterium]|nr:DUF1643 domain-containing protein [Phycisphaerales bacterium]
MIAGVAYGAALSPCGKYRYELTRFWDGRKPAIAFVMLNPSTADAQVDDPTIRRCIGFAQAWGYGELRVYNLFALRATEPAELLGDTDPVGPDNAAYLARAVKCERIVCAWGAAKMPRNHQFHALLVTDHLMGAESRSLHCLGYTADGSPRHPLYVAADMQPVLFPRR